MSVQLWSINRWLRWTGFRMFVQPRDGWTPTIIGVRWYGFPGSEGWKRIEPGS